MLLIVASTINGVVSVSSDQPSLYVPSTPTLAVAEPASSINKIPWVSALQTIYSTQHIPLLLRMHVLTFWCINSIPVFCPAVVDCTAGVDPLTFQKLKLEIF